MRLLTRTFGLALAGLLFCGQAKAEDYVRVANATPTIGELPVEVALQKGMFEKAGIKIDIIDFEGGAPAIEALIGGSVDVCLCAGDHVVNLTSKGFPAEIFIGLKDKHGYALMAPPGSKLTDLASLKGQRIGITEAGSQTDNTIRWALQQIGFDPDNDVQIINVGTGGPMQAALKSGAVQAGMVVSPFIEQNIDNGFKMVDDFRVYNYPSLTLLGLTAWVKKNPDLAKRLTHVVLDSEKLILTDRQAAFAGAKALFPKMNDALLNQVLDNYLRTNVPPGGVVNPKGYALMVTMVTMADKSTRPVPYDQGVDLNLLK